MGFLALVAAILGGFQPGEAAPALTGLSVSTSAGAVTVRIEAAAPLPAFEVKRLQDPARIYVDLPGMTPGPTRQLDVGAGTVRGVRAALNQRTPAITRIVIDLTTPTTWTVSRAASGLSAEIVLMGPASATVDRTRQLAGRLAALTPSLEAMRAGTGPSDAELVQVLAEAEALVEAARAARLSGSRVAQLVSGAADAVLAAARARAAALASDSEQARRNAMSAAAGALLLVGMKELKIEEL